ncbi:MAG: LamG domain-containing protein [Spirochaetales bacterium]|nr:LamG domain-containing protein [Spirochaetales bacterium]
MIRGRSFSLFLFLIVFVFIQSCDLYNPFQETTYTATPGSTATDTPTPTATDSPTDTVMDTPTPTDSATDTVTNTPTPTDSPTDTATDTPTLTDSPTDTSTDTPTPTNSPTDTATDTPTPTDSPTDTATDTPTPTCGGFTSDNFSDGDDCGWAKYGGTWSVVSGEYEVINDATIYKSVLNTTITSDIILEADIKLVSTGQTSLIFNASNPGIGNDALQGYAAGFDSTNSTVWAGKFNNDWTELDRVKLTDATANQKLISKVYGSENGYIFGVQSGQIYMEVNTPTHYELRCGSISSATWTHLAVTWKKGGHLTGYVNDTEAGRIAASPDSIVWNTPGGLYLGVASWDQVSFPATGEMDDIRIYNKELNSTQITELYNLPAD